MSEDCSSDGCHLILGGCGFIGRHVALKLARLGHSVILADRSAPKCDFPDDVRARITWTRFDMAETDLESLIAGATAIHHYAWSTIPVTANADPSGDLTANVVPTLALLEAIKRSANRPRFIFVSSGGTVYGKLRHVPVREDHPLAPLTAHGASKAAVELYLNYYRAVHGTVESRTANPYGAARSARGRGAATTFLHRALTGGPSTSGAMARSCGTTSLLLTPPRTGRYRMRSTDRGPWIFNIASGQVSA